MGYVRHFQRKDMYHGLTLYTYAKSDLPFF
jgi:hypothetical protein